MSNDIERPDPTMVSTGYGLGGVYVPPGASVRDVLPRFAVPRGGMEFARTIDFSKVEPLTRTGRARARVRRWWRAHWWPARIRDLEAALTAERHRANGWDDW